jgi:hypothetical protein
LWTFVRPSLMAISWMASWYCASTSEPLRYFTIVSPIFTWSPRRSWYSFTSSSFTYVPFVESRSTTYQAWFRFSMRQWRRETLSLSRTTVFSCPRPEAQHLALEHVALAELPRVRRVDHDQAVGPLTKRAQLLEWSDSCLDVGIVHGLLLNLRESPRARQRIPSRSPGCRARVQLRRECV